MIFLSRINRVKNWKQCCWIDINWFISVIDLRYLPRFVCIFVFLWYHIYCINEPIKIEYIPHCLPRDPDFRSHLKALEQMQTAKKNLLDAVLTRASWKTIRPIFRVKQRDQAVTQFTGSVFTSKSSCRGTDTDRDEFCEAVYTTVARWLSCSDR